MLVYLKKAKTYDYFAPEETLGHFSSFIPVHNKARDENIIFVS